MKSVKILGKQVSVFAIAFVMLASFGSAALLSNYGTVNGEATVTQSVTVNGAECTDSNCVHDFGIISGGSTYTYCDINVVNSGDNPAPIRFVTSVLDSSLVDATDAVTVRYLNSVVLKSKDTDTWQPLNDGREATVTYELIGDKFKYEIDAIGLITESDYSLIYYADKQDRFVNWGGDNPGALIGEFTTDTTGNFYAKNQETHIATDIANKADWNFAPEYNYCDLNNGLDDYDLCTGGKLWLVPSADYDAVAKKVSWDNSDDYIYETDMITYDDINADGEALYVGTGQFEMCVEVTFDAAIVPDTYTMDMTIVPVV